MTAADPSSYSNVLDIRTDHISLEWLVNFTERRIEGSATLALVALADGVHHVILDSKKIHLKSVYESSSKTPLQVCAKNEAYHAVNPPISMN